MRWVDRKKTGDGVKALPSHLHLYYVPLPQQGLRLLRLLTSHLPVRSSAPPAFTAQGCSLIRKSPLGLLQLTLSPFWVFLLVAPSLGFEFKVQMLRKSPSVPKGSRPTSAVGTETSTESPEDGPNCRDSGSHLPGGCKQRPVWTFPFT